VYLDNLVDRATRSGVEHKEAVAYMQKRGFSISDMIRWGIGYTRVVRVPKSESPDWLMLKEATYGFRGLENRMIIPLRNMLGNVNGLQTRALGDKRYVQILMSEAKSVGAFFGLREALPAIREKRKVFVHEGAFNAMSFSRAFPNSIACLTAFLGRQQYELLKFLVDKIIIVFDNDKAGDIGRDKIEEEYGLSGIEFVSLGDSDANDLLKVMGMRRFIDHMKSRVPLLLH